MVNIWYVRSPAWPTYCLVLWHSSMNEKERGIARIVHKNYGITSWWSNLSCENHSSNQHVHKSTTVIKYFTSFWRLRWTVQEVWCFINNLSLIVLLIVWSNSYRTNIFLATYWKGYSKVAIYRRVNHLIDEIKLYKVSIPATGRKIETQTPQIILHFMQRETTSKSTRQNYNFIHREKNVTSWSSIRGGWCLAYTEYIDIFFSNSVLHF